MKDQQIEDIKREMEQTKQALDELTAHRNLYIIHLSYLSDELKKRGDSGEYSQGSV